ncbi:RNA recognition motif, partial [Trifolium medium]|nr:RNA recognition motif [Trifolium medium]
NTHQMRESVERETVGGSGSPRANSKSKKHHGYIHNVDRNSISFFVTNFPEDCTSEELWKIFAKRRTQGSLAAGWKTFGRVGDVYIPNKVDKWGRRFAFVKFREEKDAKELSSRLEDVWCGSFKLRINRSRFERNEELGRKEGHERERDVEVGEGSVQHGRSFKAALVNRNKEVEVQQASQLQAEQVLQVEVDALVLKDLERSFVGVLALTVEVRRIRTTLYMEGLSHILVTDMGRNMVLLFSPKEGELEAMTKFKPDWLRYYFKEVTAWSPSCYADRRDTWVKVFGIPLHVWGENLFKVLGGKYGDFLDFDEATASRSRLDVARIKIATSFRGCIDESLMITALGVRYSVWVVEEKVPEMWFQQRKNFEEHEHSWVGSSYGPCEAREMEGGINGVTVEEGEEGEGVDLPLCQHHLHGGMENGDSDVSLDKESMRQITLCVAGDNLGVQKGSLFQTKVQTSKEVGVLGVVGGSLDIDLVEGGYVEGGSTLGERESDTRAGGGMVLVSGGPKNLDSEFNAEIRSRSQRRRSLSLPPFRTGGPDSLLGQGEDVGLDIIDSISDCEVRGGGFINDEVDQNLVMEVPLIKKKKEVCPVSLSRTERTSKQGGRSKPPALSVPKFLQLAEALRKGGGKRRRKKEDRVGSSCEQNCESVEGSFSFDSGGGDHEGVAESMVSDSQNEANLEVENGLPPAGINSMVAEATVQLAVNQCDLQYQHEASKLLKVQKLVGFSYDKPDGEVIKELVTDEVRDRAKKLEWEQNQGFQ